MDLETRTRLEWTLYQITRLLSRNDCLSLAIEERTGRPAEDGEQGTPEDIKRADEIFAACWRDREDDA
jgi:hypothetical protein